MTHPRTAIACWLSAGALGLIILCGARPATAACDPTIEWCITGNAGTTSVTDGGSNFLGTTDNKAIDFEVNSSRGFRLEPNATSPNVIGGFSGNSVGAGTTGATIGGGGESVFPNSVTADFGTIGGGTGHTASATFSAVGGGQGNTASGVGSTVGGGGGNTASGFSSTVAGGLSNTASGNSSFAAGHRAQALADGVFAWADSNDVDFAWNLTNTFAVRATGGVFFITAIDPSTGAATQGCSIDNNGNMGCSGTINGFSDRNAKAGFAPVDPAEVLNKLAALSIESWSYKGEDKSVRHIGPMAQDFHAAFKVGEDDKHIAMVDGDGVALAAIQGLYKMLKEKDAQIAAQQRQIDALNKKDAQIDALTERLNAIERQVRAEKSQAFAKALSRDPLASRVGPD